tara:strand:- start:508 stop:756 length:249 start_codon:yes stop_codon:yes gene_type:complete
MDKKIKVACDEITRIFNLSGTEKHIVMLISQGHSPKEISEIRDRSIETVRTQIKQIMHKFGVNRMNSIVLEVFRIANEKDKY